MAQQQPRDTEGIRKMWNNAHLSDVVICIGNSDIYAHRAYLSIASEYFERMFAADSQFAEAQTRRVELQGDDHATVELCMKWIYGFPISFEGDSDQVTVSWMKVWQTADKYLLRTLCADALATLKTTYLTAKLCNLRNLIAATDHCHTSEMPYGLDMTSHIGHLCKLYLSELLERPQFLGAMDKNPSLATQVFENSPHIVAQSSFLNALFYRILTANDGTMVYNMLKTREADVWSRKPVVPFVSHVLTHPDGVNMVKEHKDLCAGWLFEESSWC